MRQLIKLDQLNMMNQMLKISYIDTSISPMDS